MTALDGLGGVAAAAMQARTYMAGKQDDRVYRFHIRLVIVSNNCAAPSSRRRNGIAILAQYEAIM